MEKFWSNSHLVVSILLTALVLTGGAAIVHYAAETDALEDVEEDTSIRVTLEKGEQTAHQTPFIVVLQQTGHQTPRHMHKK